MAATTGPIRNKSHSSMIAVKVRSPSAKAFKTLPADPEIRRDRTKEDDADDSDLEQAARRVEARAGWRVIGGMVVRA